MLRSLWESYTSPNLHVDSGHTLAEHAQAPEAVGRGMVLRVEVVGSRAALPTLSPLATVEDAAKFVERIEG